MIYLIFCNYASGKSYLVEVNLAWLFYDMK